jgi:hypothetical protein
MSNCDNRENLVLLTDIIKEIKEDQKEMKEDIKQIKTFQDKAYGMGKGILMVCAVLSFIIGLIWN